MPTTHHRVRVDLDHYIRLAPPAAAHGVSVREAALGPVDVWLDTNRLVRRMSFAFASQTYDITSLVNRSLKGVALRCLANA